MNSRAPAPTQLQPEVGRGGGRTFENHAVLPHSSSTRCTCTAGHNSGCFSTGIRQAQYMRTPQYQGARPVLIFINRFETASSPKVNVCMDCPVSASS
jgi:hypothetical protein